VVKDAKKALGRSAFKPALKGVAQILDAWLSDMHTVASLEASLEQSIHKRLLYTLETSSLSGFEKDPELKILLERLKKPLIHPAPELALLLEGFLVDNKLLSTPEDERVTVKVVQEHEVELIAYEWLG